MRTVLRWLTVFVIVLGGWAVPQAQADSRAAAAPAPAWRVTGQPNATPALTALSPSTVAAGSPAFTLAVNGTDFVSNTVVSWNGSVRPTTYLTTTQLTAIISATDVASVGTFSVTVSGGTSPITLTVYTRAAHDTTADTVQGQPNFTSSVGNNPLMPPANQLNGPVGLAVDAQSGRLFVADVSDNRVLSWPDAAALANGQAADLVIGQPDFTSTAPNNGVFTPTANSLNLPDGVTLDAQGNLYVADNGNQRVLEYNTPLSNGMAASRVFGQNGSFTTTAAFPVSANTLCDPSSVALDTHGHLYVADFCNNRVLEFDTPLSNTTPDRVFGQGGSFTTTANLPVTANSLYFPNGVALDAHGHLYVAEGGDNRVLEYDTPLSNTTADHVFGQGGSFTTTANLPVTADSLTSPYGVALDALGNLYVADAGNNRVLEYNRPLSNTTADEVFGQGGSFTTTAVLPVSANSLSDPVGVALDAQGNLFGADVLNHRVLEYDRPAAVLKVFLPLVRR